MFSNHFAVHVGVQILPNTFQIELKPLKIEFGKPFWFRARSGGAPGVPWGELWVSRASFWDDSMCCAQTAAPEGGSNSVRECNNGLSAAINAFRAEDP